ncbi:hypothetical protein Scep_018504 [Stephania cephalantha]|uniref:Uncharacterized protein n=1 Tax=Stephania cephalantha TaxID=152367 RepID=A0AAP0I989_9MAGN
MRALRVTRSDVDIGVSVGALWVVRVVRLARARRTPPRRGRAAEVQRSSQASSCGDVADQRQRRWRKRSASPFGDVAVRWREPLSKEVQFIRGENENFNMKAETMTVEEVKRQRSKATGCLKL